MLINPAFNLYLYILGHLCIVDPSGLTRDEVTIRKYLILIDMNGSFLNVYRQRSIYLSTVEVRIWITDEKE